MDEKTRKVISTLASWKELQRFEKNASAQQSLTPEVTKALDEKAIEFGMQHVLIKTERELHDLTDAESKIVRAAGTYVGLTRRYKKTNSAYTIRQLVDIGLKGAAEASVCKSKPTLGFQALQGHHLDNLSYEQIIFDHPNEFSQRALWYARRTLGHPNESSRPPRSSERNPPWLRDELLLALNLYLQHRKSPPGKQSPEVAELSEFLNQMGNALCQNSLSTYRNANGVYMKMMNFRRFDPEYKQTGGVGLIRGNKDEAVVWDMYAHDPQKLSDLCEAIRSGVCELSTNNELAGTETDMQEAEEGRILTRLHRVRERRPELVKLAKKTALRKYGRLFCEACGFDFEKRYGATGREMIEVHHTKPLHTMSPGEKTRVQDLVLLCANCHRVVHSSRQWLSVAQVAKLVKDHHH